ncbi:M81 family metallopeptidase [Streptosporangium sp. NBC_01755]|uniref:M81 family metallopeptidase n=1 Tax=unclassified Streptosporangium TaxID=2632669 RepID=UPI002DD7B638|nr:MULTISPECIES: M81 family metallopeptidase [unclassified Streptosporangium]WSA24149.1 M81 family metallopeptidase [Streptosporangium sp. NBC_01810]WSC97777.1 M81 family metallopeptidase [Streptosporangium sp. NBC_01755]
MTVRIGLGGIWQETNTFAVEPTTLADFRRYQFFEGPELVASLRGTGTEPGGAIDAARQRSAYPVGLFFGAALPSGTVRSQAFESMLRRLVAITRARLPLDGLVLSLHGAMVVDGHPDPEAEIVTALRAVVGDIPIGATLDYHANVGATLPEVTDILVGYRTYPHVDMAERGAEAMEAVLRLLRASRTGRRPARHLERLPLLTVPPAQEDVAEPMRSILAAAEQLRAEPGVWAASALPGFAYAESGRLGFAVYLAAETHAVPRARELAAHVWRERDAFSAPLVGPADAVAAVAGVRGPTVLVDVADNVGGGSPGDGTALLHALTRAGVSGVVAVIWDPVSVSAAHAGSADRMELWVGGHSDPAMGPPFRASGPVRRFGSVSYLRTGSYMRGQRVEMGRVAVIEAPIGAIVLTENRVVPFDDDHLRALDLAPRSARVIVAKGAIAWKAAFAGYAAQTVYVRTPGYCPAALDQLDYRSRPAPLYPLERDPAWESAVAAGLTSGSLP